MFLGTAFEQYDAINYYLKAQVIETRNLGKDNMSNKGKSSLHCSLYLNVQLFLLYSCSEFLCRRKLSRCVYREKAWKLVCW